MSKNKHVYVIQNEDIRSRVMNVIANVPIVEGKRWKVTFEEYKANRSLEQNKRYWQLLSAMADHLNENSDVVHTSDILHIFFRNSFLGKDVLEVKGKILEHPRSTSKLNVAEFSEYMQKVEAFIASQGVMIGN